MQERGFFSKMKAAVTLCLVLLMLAQQVCGSPVALQEQVETGSDQPAGSVLGDQDAPALRRTARMTPLWRLMNSKPFGAYCQNNYECSTGLCRAGHCSNIQRSASEPVKY